MVAQSIVSQSLPPTRSISSTHRAQLAGPKAWSRQWRAHGCAQMVHAQPLRGRAGGGVNERTMLSRLARFAAAMYAELEAVELRQRITLLERKFKARSQRV